MELKEIYLALEEQIVNLQKFINVVKQQQRALIENNVYLIEESLSNEERMISLITSHEDNLVKIINAFARENSLNIDNPVLNNLIDELIKRKVDVVQLTKLRNDIKSLVANIIKTNTQNKLLIDNARNFIKETISALMASKKILDRKM